jgi:hypothetical protein
MKEDDLKERLKQIDKEQLEEIIFKVYKEITLKLDKDYKLQKEFKEKKMDLCIEDIENEIKKYTFVLEIIEKYIKEK